MIALRRSRRLGDLRLEPRLRTAAFVVIVGLLSGVAMLLFPPSEVSYDVGVVADRSVRAPRSVSFVSPTLTQAERERAAEAVPQQYRRDPGVAVAETGALASTVAAIEEVRTNEVLAREERIGALTRIATTPIEVTLASQIVDLGEQWPPLAGSLERTLQNVYAQGIRPEQLDQARADLPEALPAEWSEPQRAVAAALLGQHLRINEVQDATATGLAKAAARQAVAQVQVQVVAGEVVVREGSAVTAGDVEKLRALGLVSTGINWSGALGLLGWGLLIAGVVALFLERYAEEAWADDRRLVLLGLSLLVLTAVGRIVVPGAVAVYFVPFAAVAMMLTVLVGGRSALATQIGGALHVGIMSGQVELVAYVLVPALLGIAAVRSATTARQFVTGAINVTGGNLGVLGAFLLVGRATDVLGLLQLGAGAVTSGVLSGLLAFGGVVLLGHLFRITTVFELRELSDPNHPLLRQLLLRTPGTYHHSLLVANLAERAAERIGADALLARVGAYYHDIGKMRNPLAFIENQTGRNPHDALDPLVSAQIVSAHIRDGLALAERYRLPERIREMIPAHHGTSVVKYFYQTALERGQQPDEAQFRHPGPRPQTREAATVMLADGVEASVRSLEEKTADTIRAMVDKIVNERVEDGQLDECDITLRDVQLIKDAFCELLLGVYHERIPYPEDRIARIDQRPAASR